MHINNMTRCWHELVLASFLNAWERGYPAVNDTANTELSGVMEKLPVVLACFVVIAPTLLVSQYSQSNDLLL